jgi:hypothetical protein
MSQIGYLATDDLPPMPETWLTIHHRDMEFGLAAILAEYEEIARLVTDIFMPEKGHGAN